MALISGVMPGTVSTADDEPDVRASGRMLASPGRNAETREKVAYRLKLRLRLPGDPPE